MFFPALTGLLEAVNTTRVSMLSFKRYAHILYFTVHFMDETSFCVRYACDMFAVGAELSDWQSGDFHIIREYMKPMPR